ERTEEAGHALGRDRDEERLAAREGPVEIAFGEPRLGAELLDGGRRVTFGALAGERGVEEPAPPIARAIRGLSARVQAVALFRRHPGNIDSDGCQIKPSSGGFPSACVSRYQRRVDQGARRDEGFYRALFEVNPAIKLLLDPRDGRIVDANQAAEAFYGYPREVLRAMRIAEINVLTADELRDEMEDARVGRRRYFRFRHRTASGEIRHVEVH